MDIMRKIKDGEKPLDNIVEDGGFTNIFRTMCFIGDSLSSGEFEAVDKDGSHTFHDMYEYSFGQYIGRMCSSTVYNFSQGGMTAKRYCDSFAEERGFWNNKYASQCYVIALGVNDIFGGNSEITGTGDVDINDWHNNKNTFAGNYGKIIQRVKEIQKRAKIFLVTMPREHDSPDRAAKKEAHRALLYDFAEMFDNTYVIDLYKYAPDYDDEFKKVYYLSGHMNPMGYYITAKMIASYIDYIIRDDFENFKEVGFIGTDLHG